MTTLTNFAAAIPAASALNASTGWQVWDTGGGCKAYARELMGATARLGFILATSEDGCSLPTDLDQPVTYGLYACDAVGEAEEVASVTFTGRWGLGLYVLNAMCALETAVKLDDLDAAVRELQDPLGQTDGGLAGMVFSHLEEGQWARESEAYRWEGLLAYLQQELMYRDDMHRPKPNTHDYVEGPEPVLPRDVMAELGIAPVAPTDVLILFPNGMPCSIPADQFRAILATALDALAGLRGPQVQARVAAIRLLQATAEA